jgi:signal transduction histidine kinase
MSFGEYLIGRLGQLLLKIISVSAMSAFLYFTGTAPGVIAIVISVWALGFIANLLYKHHRINSRVKELESVMDGLDKKYLFSECISKPKDIYERKLFGLMRRSGKSMIEAVSEAENISREYREYIEGWVHEIKAPITAAQLVCGNGKSEQSRKVSVALAQIEEHVQRALYYARAGSVEKDFIIRKTSLLDIVRGSLAKYQTLLIHSGVSAEAERVCGIVYTDGKWVSFMIGQLLSNAIRYRREEPVIRFESVREGDIVRLIVTDNGIGIPPEDLPRVFERGFTGKNGRAKGQSTGMGLYICKKLADFLQIKIEVKSAEGEYTGVCLTFPAKLSKM